MKFLISFKYKLVHIDDKELNKYIKWGKVCIIVYNLQAPFLVSAKHLTEKEHNDLMAYPLPSHRPQMVEISNALPIIGGVPQGSVLGPVLNLLSTNEYTTGKVQSPTSSSFMGMTFIKYLQDNKKQDIYIYQF